MRFLSIVRANENQGPVPQGLEDAMAKVVADSLKNGSLVQTGGLGECEIRELVYLAP